MGAGRWGVLVALGALVAKLIAARERKIAGGGRGGGRFTYAEKVPEVVAAGARVARTAPVAAAEAVHGDSGSEDVARRIGTRRAAVPFPAAR
jgi:hypothetical protein